MKYIRRAVWSSIAKQTFSRKTRNGYWKCFKLWLIEEGCMWTSLLLSYHTARPFVEVLAFCLRVLTADPIMPSSVAATFGYKPAHIIACKRFSRINTQIVSKGYSN